MAGVSGASRLECLDCSTPITVQSKTGRCRGCANRWNAKQPDFQRRRSEGILRGFLEHPERKDAYRAQLAAAAKLPHAVERRRENAKAMRLWEIGLPLVGAKGSPSRMRAGKRRVETLMAWCPPQLRADYRQLVYSKKLRAREARQVIEQHHETEMVRWRREIGA
jgi:hypothetical protein